ncbi:FMN-binding protein [uncultured Tessaracoccus sp.]|uniref:FMN-binding protein n=1 Tax=uncultured Tessaracoccus sp. TaxID=905023 RepID=UPI0025CF4589|nr:FMN-binding protein [uncultured Tessaracoccus sp.]
MSLRSTALAAFASLSLLAIGWGVTQPLAQADIASADVPGVTSSATAGRSPDEGSASSGTYRDGTYTGTTASNQFGDWTVTATISGGQITDVQAQTTAGDHHSARINEFAVPTLREEVLSAQSVDVDMVSGATLTSDSYLTSLQSALDEARQ